MKYTGSFIINGESSQEFLFLIIMILDLVFFAPDLKSKASKFVGFWIKRVAIIQFNLASSEIGTSWMKIIFTRAFLLILI
jgi:hypothetical protein